MARVDCRPPLPLSEVAVRTLVLFGFLTVAVPSCFRADREALKAQCMGNLCQIYSAAYSYSYETETNCFPLASDSGSPRAHESLNELIAFEPEALEPSFFACPEGEGVFAERAPDGSFVLKAANLDYTWVAAKMRNTQVGKALSSDKYVGGYRDQAGTHHGHAGGMNVIFTDRSVGWVKDEELPSETMLPAGLTR